MVPFLIFLRRLRRKLIGAFYGAIAMTFVVVIYATLSEYYLENSFPGSGIHNLFESLWWVMQTITTVGYGDTPVVGLWGRLNAIFVMLAGVTSLGILTASIAANLVTRNLAARLGERRIKMKDHVIVCNNDEGLNDILLEFEENGIESVLVDREDPRLSGVNYTYVKGSCSVERDLENAGIERASKIIVLPEKGVHDPPSADAKTILTSMVIRKIKVDAYIIVELFRPENRDHAVLAGANEVIVRGAMSTLLVASAVTAPGVIKLLYELLRGEDGYRIKEYRVDNRFRGKRCGDIYSEMEKEGRVVLGFRLENTIKIRPAGDALNDWESVVVMEQRPK